MRLNEPDGDVEPDGEREGAPALLPMVTMMRDAGAPAWPHLPPGTPLTVVKLAPDGSEVTRYAGMVMETGVPSPWLAVEAWWINRRVEMNGLAFETGDRIEEFFSPADPFNLFAVFAPDGHFRGWYANVTYPAMLDPRTDPPTLTWHDLYLDVVALPDRTYVLRDEDELAEAGLLAAHPDLHAAIVAAAEELLRRLAAGAFPFHQGDAGS